MDNQDDKPQAQELIMARHRATSGRSLRIMQIAVAILLLLTGFSWLRGQGHSLRLQTNAAGARFVVDGDRSGTISSAVVLEHLPAGTRHVQLSHRDYLVFSKDVNLGWFSSSSLNAQMTLAPVALEVVTDPGAEVLLDGSVRGTANAQGILRLDVLPKQYVVAIRLKGHDDWSRPEELHPPAHRIYARLPLNAEGVREIQEQERIAQEKRMKLFQYISDARRLFAARNYQGAIAALDAALSIDSGNSEALSLRGQVEQTMKILGGR